MEAMTCVCSVGLDMIAVPGDTEGDNTFRYHCDEMAIGMVNQKTTAVRLIPVIGKGVGETWNSAPARVCADHARQRVFL